MRTSSENETAALILTLHKTVCAARTGAACAGDAPVALPRKRHGDAFTLQLMCTRGISAVRAQRIRAAFGSAAELVRRVGESPDDAGAAVTAAIGSRRICERLCDDLGCPLPAKRARGSGGGGPEPTAR